MAGLLDDIVERDPRYDYGTLLPFRKNRNTKQVEFAAPGLIKDMARAVTAPERAYQGLFDADSPEAVMEAANIAGLLGEGAVAAIGTRKQPKGQVNIFIGNGAKTWDAGEAEARLTQSRMNMTMPERLNVYPYDMLDVPQEQLIIRGLLGQ